MAVVHLSVSLSIPLWSIRSGSTDHLQILAHTPKHRHTHTHTHTHLATNTNNRYSVSILDIDSIINRVQFKHNSHLKQRNEWMRDWQYILPLDGEITSRRKHGTELFTFAYRVRSRTKTPNQTETKSNCRSSQQERISHQPLKQTALTLRLTLTHIPHRRHRRTVLKCAGPCRLHWSALVRGWQQYEFT